jgi:hypothetical protein
MVGTEAGSMTFSKLLGSSVVFLCENHIDRRQERLAELRANWQRTLQNRPYGIIGIATVDVEISTNLADWGKLLDRPDLDTSAIHSFSMGPRLRFHPGRGNRLLGIEFSCADLKSTAQQLIDKRSLVPTADKRLTLSPGRMDGLTIGFSQSSTTRADMRSTGQETRGTRVDFTLHPNTHRTDSRRLADKSAEVRCLFPSKPSAPTSPL